VFSRASQQWNKQKERQGNPKKKQPSQILTGLCSQLPATHHHFDTLSFSIYIKLLGICFSNLLLIVIYFNPFTLFVADD